MYILEKLTKFTSICEFETAQCLCWWEKSLRSEVVDFLVPLSAFCPVGYIPHIFNSDFPSSLAALTCFVGGIEYFNWHTRGFLPKKEIDNKIFTWSRFWK